MHVVIRRHTCDQTAQGRRAVRWHNVATLAQGAFTGETIMTRLVMLAVGVMAIASPQAQTGRDSMLCGVNTPAFSNSLNEDDRGRSWRLKSSAPGCQIDLKQDGRIEFTDDFNDIKSLSAGGSFELSVLKGGIRRDLSVSSKNGSLARTWKVDGRERPYDDDARKWFAAFLIDLDHQTAAGVDSRVPALLGRGGVSAVLKETEQMPSDYARSIYYTKLAAATKLTAAELAAILDQATSLHADDYHATELLQNLALPQLSDATVHAAALRLLAAVKSDLYVAQGIQTLTRDNRVVKDDVDFAIAAASRMSSDHFKAEVVRTLMGTGRVDSAVRTRLATITTDMHEDYDINDVIEQLMAGASAETSARRTMLEAAGRIKSDNYRATSLKALLKDRSLVEMDLLDFVAAARKMTTDSFKAEVLIAIARHSPPTPRVRDAVATAADSLARQYRDSVRQAVGR